MSDEVYCEIGHRIKELRMKRKYSREKLAGMADISQKFLYEIEFGKKGFSVYTLINIANSLGVSCDYIIMGSKYVELELYDALRLFEPQESERLAEVLRAVYKLGENQWD